MFVDLAKVFIAAGRGGNGAVNFRQEKYIDKGGPDGGDGGKGGDIYFVGDQNLNTLLSFRFQRELKAAPGQDGGKRNRHGQSGDDLIVKVPVGTLVKNTDGKVIADIISTDTVLVARGGEGGFGNAHFKSSTRQAPRIGELGIPGESLSAHLELKLLADVGVIGLPNAGKSTFLSVVTNAKPEVASYAFTTLSPNLGVADIDDTSLLLADIPGLIEGASEGKGLGDAFLRHIERTSVLLHLIDAYQEDGAAAYQAIRRELRRYNPRLCELPEVMALTKSEGLDEEMIDDKRHQLQLVLPPKTPLFIVSSTAHKGLKEVLRELARQVKKNRVSNDNEIPLSPSVPTISLNDQQKSTGWQVEKSGRQFIVKGEQIEKFALKTDFNNPHSLNRLRDIMRKIGVAHELERQGASGRSEVRIGTSKTFTLAEQ